VNGKRKHALLMLFQAFTFFHFAQFGTSQLSQVPKYFPPNFGNFQKLRIWQHVTVLRTGVSWPPGRAGVVKPPAGLG